MFRLTDISQGSSSDILLRILFFCRGILCCIAYIGFCC